MSLWFRYVKFFEDSISVAQNYFFCCFIVVGKCGGFFQISKMFRFISCGKIWKIFGNWWLLMYSRVPLFSILSSVWKWCVEQVFDGRFWILCISRGAVVEEALWRSHYQEWDTVVLLFFSEESTSYCEAK